MSEVENSIQETSNTIGHLIESFIELGILIHDFQGTETSKEALSIKLNQTIDDLKLLQSAPLQEVPIPLDVLQYIEDGRNPDVYTREFVEATRKSNQYLRGKMNSFKNLREVLGKKIINEFPELESIVNDINDRTNG
ncbi:hypothetical protein WICMUC_000265 [Wickerhamomyces mucosus]|uniref:Mediator of RNA polymerase II transcription subunit 10 n=1 Tax=Wickerhamomyces mucosus TaxID=1378264 RepID=A0A9P8Q0E4_9ASCO|nr:hypothetical protein WICMUC_000265 [Wickerhamomyces mucosus]